MSLPYSVTTVFWEHYHYLMKYSMLSPPRTAAANCRLSTGGGITEALLLRAFTLAVVSPPDTIKEMRRSIPKHTRGFSAASTTQGGWSFYQTHCLLTAWVRVTRAPPHCVLLITGFRWRCHEPVLRRHWKCQFRDLGRSC